MKLLCLGDSNTYGFDPRSYLGGRFSHPWPSLLAERLSSEVINLGENGAEIPHSQGMMTLRIRQIEKHLPADLLIMMLGTNDVLQTIHEPEKTAAKRMDFWLSRVQEIFPALPILLLAPPDVYGHQLGCLYREAAEKHGTPFADCNTWSLPLAFDGVHLTEEGHQQMSEKITEIIWRK